MSPLDCLPEIEFHPVVKLPSDYEVLDFTGTYDGFQPKYSVGRYNEKRPQVYTTEQFTTENRTIHMGVDLGAPAGTSVYAFFEGEIFLCDNISKEGDYGPVIVTRHILMQQEIYALHGHLSLKSLEGKKAGQKIKKGEVIGWLGDESVNGGWPPHVHFQLCLEEPQCANIPGVVSEDDHQKALEIYPDPRYILGPLY